RDSSSKSRRRSIRPQKLPPKPPIVQPEARKQTTTRSNRSSTGTNQTSRAAEKESGLVNTTRTVKTFGGRIPSAPVTGTPLGLVLVLRSNFFSNGPSRPFGQ